MNVITPFCIDLDQPALEGFRSFISSWCWQKNGRTLVVDPGPLSTIRHLTQQLRARGVERVDYILLTHIHIDHAGGTAALLDEFPMARVVCHPDGVRHMIAPEKLWRGSKKVLGERVAAAYGEILPLPAERVGFIEELSDVGLKSYLTPGHAPHHCCYMVDDLLFAGEVAGVRCPVDEGIYMRPATPPRFIQNIAIDSLERMLTLQPRRMVFAHYGLVEDAVEHLKIGRRQLDLWVQGVAATLDSPEEDRRAVFVAWLLQRDVCFARIDQLGGDLRRREEEFVGNAFRGMCEYVTNLSVAEQRALAAA